MLKDKLTEFYNALKAIAVALGLVTIKCQEVAERISAVKTQFNMGTKTVTIKQNAIIYGITFTEDEQDPEKRLTYTDDAKGRVPVKTNTTNVDTTNYYTWTNSWIFDKVYPVMLKTNGQIDYLLDPNNHELKKNGEYSDCGDWNYDGNAMVCVEKFYIKYSMSGNNECIQISDKKLDGFDPIGFIREDGSEADKFFLPMYLGYLDNNDKLRSLRDSSIKINFSWDDARTAIQKNGNGYDIESWAMNQAFQTFYFILMKNCDPKVALGNGKLEYPNPMTGGTKKKGAIAYDPQNYGTKFLWVEDYTTNYAIGGIKRWENGLLCQGNKMFVKMKPPYSGNSVTGYTEVNGFTFKNDAYVSAMKCSNQYGRYPVTFNGTDSTYESALWDHATQSQGNIIYPSRRGYRYGISGRVVNNMSGTQAAAGLSYLPPA